MWGLPLVLAPMVAGCGPDLYPEDQKHADLLNERFGNRYEFQYVDNLHALAISKEGVTPSQEEVARIHETFFGKGSTRETPFGFLVVYKGKWNHFLDGGFDEEQNEYVFTRPYGSVSRLAAAP